MSGYRQLTDWNFDGWSNGELASEVQKLSGSSMAARFSEASEALRSLAGTLESVDQTIRDQLKVLKIDWDGAAGKKSQEKTDVVAAGLEQSTQATTQSSQAMTQQGESTSQARHSTPPPQDLRGDTEQNFGDKVGGFFGIETDHAKEVAATNAARQQAIDSLNGYVNGSQNSLNGFRAPNTPPDIVVASGAVAPSVGSPVGMPTGGPPGITGGGPGYTGGPGTPGSPGFTGTPGLTPGAPGNTTGVLPGANTGTPVAAGLGLPKPSGVPSFGTAAAALGAAGLAGGATGARGAQVVGGGRGPSQAPKTPIAPTGPKGAPSTIGGGKSGAGGAGAGAGGTGAAGKGPGGAMTPGGASGVGPEAGRGGAAAAGKGGVAGKGGGSLMSPAASAARGEGEEDGEHVRKYGVDSDEMFGDDRMVVQSVIGEDPKDK
ncbi:PPE domain-containing protein [Lentzea sp. NPDC055074]